MPLFDRDRYQRLPLDVSGGGGGGGGGGRRPSSSSCATVTIVIFVGLCLVGAWMMASTSSVPVGVSPEDKPADDIPTDFTRSVDGGDTPQMTEEAGVNVDRGSSGTPQRTDEAGATATKDDDGAATRTTDAAGSNEITQTGVTETVDAAGGEVPSSKNQTLSDEKNGKTEGGGPGKPEDPDNKAEDSAAKTTTGVQPDKSAKEAPTDTNQNGAQDDMNAGKTEEAPKDTTSTGDQVDKDSEDEPTEKEETGGQSDKITNKNSEDTPTEKEETGGQSDKITDKNAEETPAYAKDAGDDGTPKNQTAFDDQNGNLDGDQNGDTAAGGGISKNQTFGDQYDAAPKNQTFAAVDGINGTISQESEMVLPTTNSSTAAEEKTPEASDGDTIELLPSGQAELLNETTTASAALSGTFPTQASESSEEKKARASRKKKKDKNKNSGAVGETSTEEESYVWKLCNVTAGADYIPCLDNEEAIKRLKSTKHYEHRERHCPSDAPSCLVPLPEGYRRPIPWPHSREKIWYSNVPHTKLASYKGNQNWVKISGEHLTFPGGGTQFPKGASHYIDVIQEALPDVAWGRRSRVVLDVGCGVASFGGYLFDRDALTMSLAPKDEHEAQVQFALERGIPAISAVMGTKRLPFPGGAFDLVHCARCRVPWDIDGGKLLLEVNRLLRPGGLFVWSATPVYRKNPVDVGIWHAMAALTKSMCWDMEKRTSDAVDQTAMVIFKKPSSNDCYRKRPLPEPPLCDSSDDPNAAWNITLQSCMHRVPTDRTSRGSRWPGQWPERLAAAPYWLNDSQVGAYGKPAPDDFAADSEHWRNVVTTSYLTGVGIDWTNVRNVMDMRSIYGGLAAALRNMKVWVMNVVAVDSPDTLPIIYERGLFGMYHDWCESFSTYPRSYDLVHADHLFSKLKDRCKLTPVMAEVDRILRPKGKMIVRDDRETAEEVQRIARSLHWEETMAISKEGERLLCFTKTMWQPSEVEARS